MSNRNGTTQQACAACKYQRRKCAPDCILAPYFPHDRQRQFLNAHKLFGVSNITKIIRNLQPPAKDQAMHTIIFQSDARAHDPVGGCHRIIRELEREIEFMSAELNLVLHQLSICRAQAHQNHQIQTNDDSNNNNYALYYQQQQQQQQQQEQEQEDHHQQQHHLLLQQNDQEQQYMRMVEEISNHNDLAQQEEDPTTAWVMQDSMSSLNIKQDFGDECGGDDEMKPILEVPNYERNQLHFEAEETKTVEQQRLVPLTTSQIIISM